MTTPPVMFDDPNAGLLLTSLATVRDRLLPFLDPRLSLEDRMALTLALRPLSEDGARVFTEPFASSAAPLFEHLWNGAPPLAGRPDQTELTVRTALSDDFHSGHPRATEFPGGYTNVAEIFQPGVVWASWRFHAPGTPYGLAFDGIAIIDERLAWFPRPWQMARL